MSVVTTDCRDYSSDDSACGRCGEVQLVDLRNVGKLACMSMDTPKHHTTLYASSRLWQGNNSRLKRRIPPGTHHAPGPAGLPVLGNAHQLRRQPHQQITAWAREYGQLYKIRLGWNDWYMICSPEACKEILDKQSVHSSSRAPQPVAGDTLSGGMRFLFMPYGPEWRNLGGIGHKLLTLNVSATFKPSQEYEAKLLLEEMLHGANDEVGNDVSYMAIRRYTVSVMMTSTYGRRIPHLMNDFSVVATRGAYLADALPFFGKAPTSSAVAKLWMPFFMSPETQMETKQAPDCFVKQFIESNYEKQGITELQAAFLAGSMIEAGSETTPSALNTAVLYLSANPDVQRVAQAQIDELVGCGRSPTFDDEEALPCIRAIVKETLRMRPVTSIGTPHYTTASIIYKDIYISANSVVAPEQYPIHYNLEIFPEPQRFNPDCFLNHRLGSGHYAGGPASARDYWALRMFIVLAKLLWAFDIVPSADETGNSLPVDHDGGKGLAKARWRARTEESRQTILKEVADARRDGYVLKGVKVGEGGMEVEV
ncbi:cytochrome P450 [Setomelanomma holmii]|uniref:Cytochrome P450 n=1 Tax=Setomelanomma holmii TaxID=210430 RepID=A0A9P4H4N7_9PLEO|nr:cytochrome P450 [Setomelanomma holmii]